MITCIMSVFRQMSNRPTTTSLANLGGRIQKRVTTGRTLVDRVQYLSSSSETPIQIQVYWNPGTQALVNYGQIPTANAIQLSSIVRRITTEAKPTPSIAPATGKKRTKAKRKPVAAEDTDTEVDRSTYPVVAYATCDEIDLEKLRKGLVSQGLYIPTVWAQDSGNDNSRTLDSLHKMQLVSMINNTNLLLDAALNDVVHVLAKYPTSEEPRELFFFREGTVVFWNVPDLERYNVLK